MRRTIPILAAVLMLAALTPGSAGATDGPPGGGNAGYWVTYFTADLPGGYWAEGEYGSFYDWYADWSFPEPGWWGPPFQAWFPNAGTFTVSSEAPLYHGFVLIRVSGIYALSSSPPGPLGPQCQQITSFNPAQPTRLMVGWYLDDPRTEVNEPVTAAFARAHMMSMTSAATPVGGTTMLMQRHETTPYDLDTGTSNPDPCLFTIRG